MLFRNHPPVHGSLRDGDSLHFRQQCSPCSCNVEISLIRSVSSRQIERCAPISVPPARSPNRPKRVICLLAYASKTPLCLTHSEATTASRSARPHAIERSCSELSLAVLRSTRDPTVRSQTVLQRWNVMQQRFSAATRTASQPLRRRARDAARSRDREITSRSTYSNLLSNYNKSELAS